MKKLVEGGVSLGPCGVSLHSATLSFALADIIHGIIGIMVLISMIVKIEGDEIDRRIPRRAERLTGYSDFLEKLAKKHYWVIYWLLASFVFQITMGMVLVLGAVHRNSSLVSSWLLISIITSPTCPATYCLVIIGRVFMLATVFEFLWKMDDKDETRYSAVKRQMQLVGEEGKPKFRSSIEAD